MKLVPLCLIALFCVSAADKSVRAADFDGREPETGAAVKYKAVEYEEVLTAAAGDGLTEPDAVFAAADSDADEVGLLEECYSDCGSSCCKGPLRSDREFDTFIEPVTNSVFFEDPRSMTRIRFWFLNQMIPSSSILGDGDLQLYAMQATFALSERLTVIAEKDGYIAIQADGIANQQGWADLGTGLKYVIVRDTCNQFLLSGGFLYEWSQGSADVFQGNGDGVWNLFLTTGKGFGDSHFVGTVGWHLPNNGSDETQSMFYSLHLDHMLTCQLYALWEFTGIHYLESGRAMPGVNQEGGDLINLGANAVAGNTFATTAFGLVYKLSDQTTLGAAYEFPVTDREDLFDNRTTVTISWTY